MSDYTPIVYAHGLQDDQTHEAALLYESAFGQKFSVAIKSTSDRINIIEAALDGEFAYSATAGDRLVGLAGFHTRAGSLTSGITPKLLIAKLGYRRGLRAIAVFSFYERSLKEGELLMDGISVHESHRGQGIGGRLLDEIIEHGKTHQFDSIRLDVIDTNPQAQKLYERKGFTAVKVERFPYMRWLFGFGGSTTMVYSLNS